MKRLFALLLIFLLLLCGCGIGAPGDATPDQPIYTTPNGTEFIIPDFSSAPITDEVREQYLNFCQTYEVNHFPQFDYSQRDDLTKDEALGYAQGIQSIYEQFYWEYDENDNEIATLSGAVMEEFIQKRFDFSLGLTEEDRVLYDRMRAFKYRGEYGYTFPMFELTDYGETQWKDATIIRVRGKGHHFSLEDASYSKEYEYSPRPYKPMGWNNQILWKMMQDTGLMYYQCAEKLIVSGQTEELDPPIVTIELMYMIKKDSEPIFLSYAETAVDQSSAHQPVYYIPEEE